MTATDESAGRSGKTLLGIESQETFESKQAAIDRQETARVEALVQVCKLLPAQVIEDTAVLQVLMAIQHDSIVDVRERFHTVFNGLGVLAYNWHVLPIDAREVILAGLLPAGGTDRELWAQHVALISAGLLGKGQQSYTSYHQQRRTLVRAILGTETPTDV